MLITLVCPLAILQVKMVFQEKKVANPASISNDCTSDFLKKINGTLAGAYREPSILSLKSVLEDWDLIKVIFTALSATAPHPFEWWWRIQWLLEQFGTSTPLLFTIRRKCQNEKGK